MDIKLKSSRRPTIILIVAILLICSAGMVMSYPALSRQMQGELGHNGVSEDVLMGIGENLLDGNYILNNEVSGKIDRTNLLQQYGGEEFELLRKYMDYEVFNESGNALLGTGIKTTLSALKEEENTSYVLRMAFTFQKNGELYSVQVSGAGMDERTQYNVEQYLSLSRWGDISAFWQGVPVPEGVQIVYGMTEDNLNSYMEGNQEIEAFHVDSLAQNGLFNRLITIFVSVLAAVAVFLSVKQKDYFAKGLIFRIPFEIVLCVFAAVIATGYLVTKVVWLTISEHLISGLLNIGMWFVVFGIVLWGFICLGAMFTMKKAYWTERTLCARALRWMKKSGGAYGRRIKKRAGRIWRKIKGFCDTQYDALIHLDFQDKTNRTILKIIIINFVVLVVICTMWFFGIMALIIYSVVLFLFLKKYVRDIQDRYHLLLQSTSRLAEGDLEAPIEGDLGIFNPIQEELKKIQSGFKKAVDEEVKSERMKTELVTNVSHDLKTPLTAIITYTDLLKNENDAEKRKEYVQVLEQKSLRLKVLIEDLFEISKAASNNVIMNFMQVDIADLLKQVGLEYDSKIKEANLDVRWTLPDHKVLLWLDSQKTYRIFENLILNITKYAMPYTRVYVDMKELDNQVYISMKNISAAELNFNTEEITDRFVRGDASRNTEGSGLGLAIAKSFVELQNGSLKISTEADLYKVEITFPREDCKGV
ncbi:MAG: HAMP domain-containing sensor histidine kinase [Muricomes sp.]